MSGPSLQALIHLLLSCFSFLASTCRQSPPGGSPTCTSTCQGSGLTCCRSCSWVFRRGFFTRAVPGSLAVGTFLRGSWSEIWVVLYARLLDAAFTSIPERWERGSAPLWSGISQHHPPGSRWEPSPASCQSSGGHTQPCKVLSKATKAQKEIETLIIPGDVKRAGWEDFV